VKVRAFIERAWRIDISRDRLRWTWDAGPWRSCLSLDTGMPDSCVS
jgi:hypothetical protein